MNEETRTCDDDGCANGRTVQEYYDGDDDSWVDAPTGWVRVNVDRAQASVLELEFCSEEHMRARLQQPLPPPDLSPYDVPEETWGDKVFSIGCALVLIVIVLLFVLGLVTAARWLL